MNKTKEAVKNFVSRSGHHDTEVHESIQPAVTHENVKKTHHEDVNTAVDREVHHDHYHHTVQPVKDKQVLPEEHHHRVAGVEHREFDERNHDRTKQAVAAEAAKFKNERVVEPTVHSQSAAPTVAGEHHHHHIHETVQPVIERETVQPTVVHTTIPVHETHHKEAKHHGTTALPAISMDEFKSKGGSFGHDTKPHEHHYQYDGEPTAAGKIQSSARGGPVGTHGHEHSGTTGTAGATGGLLGRRRRHHKRTASNSSYSSSDFDDTENKSYGTKSSIPSTGTSGTGAPIGTSAGMNAVPRSEQSAVHNAGPGRDAAGYPVKTADHKKPSLLDKLNPKVESNGDGKAGFMK